MDEKTKEIYSRKFQFHMLELKKLKYAKEKQQRKPLYQWAKLIAAQTWEELEQESKGNKYMERALEEMIKISQDEIERYLYLREEMGEILKLITQVQKKIARGDSLEKIADDLIEDETVIKPIYQLVQGNPNKTEDDIYQMLNLL